MTDAELHREEWLSERAAILEFCGGYQRETAEAMALEEWDLEQACKAAKTAQEPAK
jgi:hypothetical protein